MIYLKCILHEISAVYYVCPEGHIARLEIGRIIAKAVE